MCADSTDLYTESLSVSRTSLRAKSTIGLCPKANRLRLINKGVVGS